MSKGAEGERFLAAFGELKNAVGNDPAQLAATWEGQTRLQNLCDQIAELIRGFEDAEDRSHFTFTNNVSPAGAHARRDYDDHWRKVVRRIANRAFDGIFAELFPDFVDEVSVLTDARPDDLLADQIAEWKDVASEEAGQIEQAFDYAFQQQEMDDCDDFVWVHFTLEAWDRLKISGLDVAGSLWRRRALPHVLIPSHVAKHYGAARASLHRRLDQAGKAFVFGAPLAALALQRAVIEETLKRHWGVESGAVRDANFPEPQWDIRASRLKRLANDALHGDPEKLTPNQLDRSIIENFLLLRLLIEHAPENLKSSGGTRK